MSTHVSRAGIHVKQPTGYRAFIPASLPPNPPINYDARLVDLLASATEATGRLDGVAQILPNPDLFVAMYVRREAVLSSQIEGTQSSLDDVLAFELDPATPRVPSDVEEVVNYVRALNHGLARLETLPLSLRLIREIHGVLLEDTRGSDKQPGEFRRSQNWIGPANVPLSDATFVPPPPSDLMRALDNFERFLHDPGAMPALVHCGLAHAQFETIHPFLDENGRVGRLLITLLLCHRGSLHRPLLYISHYLKRHRSEYYDRLTAIRESGDWEGWLRFFLCGVVETAEEATLTARAIVSLRDQHRSLIQEHGLSVRGLNLIDLLFRRPLLNIQLAQSHLDVAYQTANRLIGQFQELGILHEVTGNQRNRVFRYSPYIALFADSDLPVETRPAESGHSAPLLIPYRTGVQ